MTERLEERAFCDFIAPASQRVLAAVRAHNLEIHCLEMAGDPTGAIAHCRTVAGGTASPAERQYLLRKASRVAGGVRLCSTGVTGGELPEAISGCAGTSTEGREP